MKAKLYFAYALICILLSAFYFMMFALGTLMFPLELFMNNLFFAISVSLIIMMCYYVEKYTILKYRKQ